MNPAKNKRPWHQTGIIIPSADVHLAPEVQAERAKPDTIVVRKSAHYEVYKRKEK